MVAVASESISQRLMRLIQQFGLTKNAFAMSLDRTASVVQHLIDGRNKPGYDLLCKIFEVYPNVSRDWLLLGQGPMLLTSKKTGANETPAAEPVVAELNFAPPAPEPQPAPAPASPAAPAVVAAIPAAEATPLVASLPAPAPAAPVAASTVAPAVTSPDAYVAAALHAQHLQHQLALAEMQNQHLLAQQQLLREMLELARRPL